MNASGGGASILGGRLYAAIMTYAETHHLGAVTPADGTYDLTPPGAPRTKGTGLAPDVAFVRAERVPLRDSPVYDKAWPLAPDLVVEVASPYQYRPEMAAKAKRYLAAGVRLVWVIWPKRRQIDVWHPGDQHPTRTLAESDTLDGEDVLPGFTYPVAKVFA